MADMRGLPRDEDGRPIIPKSRVTVIVEARDVGYGACHAGCCHPLDHERPAGYAFRLRAIAADGVA